MKKQGILHPELARVVAGLGHGDTLVVADAGLPIPPGPVRIDLAYAPGKPAFLDVLGAVLQELKVEHATLAEEIRHHDPAEFHRAVLDGLGGQAGLRVDAIGYIPHEELKRRTAEARAVVRTGEFTPYANLILSCGVVF